MASKRTGRTAGRTAGTVARPVGQATGTGATAGKTQDAGKLVCCMDCVHGQLHRYDNNPVLAACMKKPNVMNERFPYQVEVASVMRRCADYNKSLVEKTIEQRSKVA